MPAASIATYRYNLYRTFVDAFQKGHPSMPRSASHHAAQGEWNKIKKNEALVKEKIESYKKVWLEGGGLTAQETADSQKGGGGGLQEKKPISKPKKRLLPEDDEDQDPSTMGQRQTNGPIHDDNRVEATVPTFSKKTKQKDRSNGEVDTEALLKEKPWRAKAQEKARKKAELAAQAKELKIKSPAQDKVMADLKEINERIANLVQVKNMGLSTGESQKTLKKLIEQKKRRTVDLKKLLSQQRASARHRERKRQRFEQLCAQNPDVAAELAKCFRPRGKMSMNLEGEENSPDLLQIIEEIACVGGSSSSQPSSQKIMSLDDLKENIKRRGYEIRRSQQYYRLMPSGALSSDGKKHVRTVPVRLRKMHGPNLPKHVDNHFGEATLDHVKDLAGIFGNDCVFFLTQDNKSKISIGRPAAKGQAPLIMHLDYQVRPVDPETVPIIPRHQLVPSVYAASTIDETGRVGYVGPTYIAVRSARHDRSTAESHCADFDRMVKMPEFNKSARDHMGLVKPIVVLTLDSSGPEDNTRFPKTLATTIDKFKKYNLDALFVLSQAPGQALYKVVERRMAPLSHDLAGLILPHDHFGTHLNETGSTISAELEKSNLKRTAEVLSEVWNLNLLDEHPVVCEWIEPPMNADEDARIQDTTSVLDWLLNQVCAEEEDQLPLEERCAPSTFNRPGPNFKPNLDFKPNSPVGYEIDEYWCATHVLQTQYTIQIIRCNTPGCCGPWRSNYIQVFPHRFLPAPVPFDRSSNGVKMSDSLEAPADGSTPFYGNLFQRIQFHGIVISRTNNPLLPFDACCPSIQNELPARICTICKQYIPSGVRLRNHYRIHQLQYQGLDHNNNDMPHGKEEDWGLDDLVDPSEQPLPKHAAQQHSVVLFTDMIEWLKSDFEDDPIVVEAKPKSTAATASAAIRKAGVDKFLPSSSSSVTTATTTTSQITTTQAPFSSQPSTSFPSKVQSAVTTTTKTTTSVTTIDISKQVVRPAPITTTAEEDALDDTPLNDRATEHGSMIDRMEDLAVIDDVASTVTQSTSSFDKVADLNELVDNYV